MRRTTLGPVSNNALNGRSSMGASRRNPRSTLGALKPPDERRQSAMPSYGRSRRATGTAVVPPQGRLSSRPSMTYASRPGVRSDPRPLHDKHYMQQCVKALISFVIDRGYDQPISPKILTNPSSRDFQHIFLFLVRCLYPTFSFQKRFEDEVPIILRCIGYPYSFSKSALSAVGSPHTWPSLLGVLTWLMGLLTYDEARKARENADQELDPQARRMHIFYDNTVEAYAQFLQGADAHPELDEALRQHFEAENSRRQNDIATLEADRDHLAATLEALQSEPSPLQLIKDQHASVETNIRKFHVLLPSLIEHHNLVSKKIQVKETETAKEDKELAVLTEEKQQLLQSLVAQEEAGIDTDRLANEKDRLREGLKKLTAHRAQAEGQLSEAEQATSNASSTLGDVMLQYRQTAAAVELLRPPGRAGRGTRDWELSIVQELSTTADERVLSKDIDEEIMPIALQLKADVSAEIPTLKELSLSLQEGIDEQEETLILRRSELSMLESRKLSLESEYQKTRSAMTNQLEARKESILRREGQIADSRNRLYEQLDEADKKLHEFGGYLSCNQEEFARHRKVLKGIVRQDTERLRMHQSDVTACLSEVEQHFDKPGWCKGE